MDLTEVDSRVRGRRTRRAAVAGSLATLLAIGAVGLGVEQVAGAGEGGDGGGRGFSGVASGGRGDTAPTADVPQQPRPAAVTVTTPDARSMTVSEFTAGCDLAGLDGTPGRSPALEIQGMELRERAGRNPRFVQALLRISAERVAPGESWALEKPTYRADKDILFFGLLGNAENSSRDEGTSAAIEIIDGDGCTPGSVVTAEVDGTIGSEDVDGALMQVSGVLSATVKALPAVVDPTGRVATDCSAIRSRDVPDFENADVEVLGDGPYGTVTLGPDGTQFLVDFEDRSCREAPGIGRLITGP